MILRKKIIPFLTFLFLFYYFFKPCLSADDILEIKISDLEPTLEVLQGKCNTVPFHITNRYNESVNIYYRIDKPSDMVMHSYPKDYTLLESGATVAGNLNVCVNEYFENETYKIRFWLETLTNVNESRVKSDYYNFDVKILYNPNLETTTTTTSMETTTVKSQIITTTPTYTTIYTTTTERTDTDTNTNNFKIGNLIDRKQLITMGVIIILLILVMIPYITFTRSKKMD